MFHVDRVSEWRRRLLRFRTRGFRTSWVGGGGRVLSLHNAVVGGGGSGGTGGWRCFNHRRRGGRFLGVGKAASQNQANACAQQCGCDSFRMFHRLISTRRLPHRRRSVHLPGRSLRTWRTGSGRDARSSRFSRPGLGLVSRQARIVVLVTHTACHGHIRKECTIYRYFSPSPCCYLGNCYLAPFFFTSRPSTGDAPPGLAHLHGGSLQQKCAVREVFADLERELLCEE